ncbi:MAG: hypothetical protein GXY32_06565 [Ruminococcaceae bacterium]|nr:hypothetical protein [Oscillospiraceae bacterium]
MDAGTNELNTLFSLLNTGAISLMAALFLLFVWKFGSRWLENQKRKDAKEDKREEQIGTMLKSITTVAERSNSVIEANTRVIEGNQKVLEQVIQGNKENSKAQQEILADLEKVKGMANKIYTEMLVIHAKNEKNG